MLPFFWEGSPMWQLTTVMSPLIDLFFSLTLWNKGTVKEVEQQHPGCLRAQSMFIFVVAKPQSGKGFDGRMLLADTP